MKKTLSLLLATGALIFSHLHAQTTLISSTVNNGGFESGTTGWLFSNGSETNQWFVGTVTNCGGTKSAYIGSASNTNNYNHNNTSIVHFYRDFVFPANQSVITLTFSFKSQGENNTDGVKVYLAPTTVTPLAGTLVNNTYQVGNTWYDVTASCTTFTITLPVTAAGTTQRLIFSWKNNGSGGTNPAASIDNVTITTAIPPVPTCATMTSPANGATSVCTSQAALTWTAPGTGGTPTGYKMYLGTTVAANNVINGTNIGLVLTYNPAPLLANTTYYWYVVPTNGGGDAVGCSSSVWSFTTDGGCYIQGSNYTTCGGTFYDTGGSSSNYSNNEANTTTICPSTAGQLMAATFTSFSLESTYDNLIIYNGNSTAAPVIGTYTGTNTPCNAVSTAANGCLTFDFSSDASTTYLGWAATLSCVPSVPSPAAGTDCANLGPTLTLPYVATGQSTACYNDNSNNTTTGSCLTIYESGEDHIYPFTVSSGQCIAISLTNCSSSNIGYSLYSNACPGSAGSTCIGSNGGASPLSGTITVPSAGTYYLVVDSWAPPSNVTYDISIQSMGSGPSNDLPCNASTLALNVNLTGDNSCSGSVNDPATPTCWSTGAVNSVWYTVVCPASGQLKIRTTLGSLTNTQIALFSGSCGSLTFVSCNDNAPACGTSTYNNSEITATGLTGGATYYIEVDGVNSLVGTFDIQAVDGAVGFLAAAGQDCGTPNPVCAQSIAVGNPGYQAYGNICDFSGTGTCLTTGERGSAWYNIPISANGNLTFDIVPNDYTGGSGCCSTDYDFAIWKVAGTGATSCSGISTGAVPVACNYSGLGVTGCYGTSNGTSPYPGYGGAYQAQIPVVAGEVYELVVSNYSNSTSGFTLNMGTTAPVNYSAVGSSVTWTGGTNTNWVLPSNWGGCASPVCGIDATIVPSAANQPVLISGTYYVNNLTINPGASLTLLAGANLHICGNLTNSGSIIANAASTITFDNGSVNQSITGAMVGSDKLGNLVINKTGGTVTMNNNMDIGGNFTTSSTTSVFNVNGKYLKVAGNFSNNNGSSTFTGAAGSTLEFNGTGAQTYNQGSSVLNLNNVVMNNSGSGVTCATNMVVNTGTLTLTAGKIITNANSVIVSNNAPAACTAGNTSSFVQGTLQRYLSGAAGSYNLPVGEAVKGYQLANITFTTATTIGNLTATFSQWATVPTGPAANECPSNTYNSLNALNNGYWTITANVNPTSGTYTTTLYSTNYTNATGASGWTVMKAPNIAGTWALSGTCAGSTASNTVRTGMNGFSVFAVAQSVTPLPVELSDFSGTSGPDFNHLKWTTASERNNAYFTLERSTDGVTFQDIGRVNGAGNSVQMLDYFYNDMNPAEGTNYYRLRQTDYNGQSTWSSIVSLDFHRGNMTVDNVRPNPTSGEVNFDFASPEETEIHYIITDLTGRIVADETRSVKAGLNVIGTLIPGESAGVYSLKVIEEKHGFVSVSRIVKY